MKTTLFFSIFLLFCSFAVTESHAQNWRNRMQWGKMDQLERMKMLDALELDEATSVKLLSRFKDFRLRQRELNFDMDSIAYELKQQIDNKRDVNQIKKLSEEYMKCEIAFNKSRIDFIYSLSDILSPEQIGKLLVFERNFKKEIQDLMLKRRGMGRGAKDQEN